MDAVSDGPDLERTGAELARVLARDPRLWPGAPDAGRWLGWVASDARAEAHLAAILPLAAAVRDEGTTDVVLAGMGGSSLFPEVLARTFGPAPGSPRLRTIDSTDPAAVLRVEREVPWASALVVAASKSGTTVETLAHLARFGARLADVRPDGPERAVVAVTDPGSPLAARAAAEGFRAVVPGDPDVGGRFSALSPFGLLPAALLGVDVAALVAAASDLRARAVADPADPDGPAGLAAFLAAGAADGRDVLHVLVPPGLEPFGAWVEQLVAESTGKRGRGVLPVVTRTAGDVRLGPRRMVVAVGGAVAAEDPHLADLRVAGVPVLVLPRPDGAALGAEVLRWMLATALLGARLGVDPFDQPDVAAAKSATAEALATGAGPGPAGSFRALEGDLASARYLAVLAYVDPAGPVADALEARCRVLGRELDVPVTLGIGPRYLHSTGQYHKGGPPGGVFAIVVGDDPEDADVPGLPYGFSALKRAQASGDLTALRAAGRTALHVDAATLLG
jgi:transaldolase/glucose-6-phosphate isomerase